MTSHFVLKKLYFLTFDQQVWFDVIFIHLKNTIKYQNWWLHIEYIKVNSEEDDFIQFKIWFYSILKISFFFVNTLTILHYTMSISNPLRCQYFSAHIFVEKVMQKNVKTQKHSSNWQNNCASRSQLSVKYFSVSQCLQHSWVGSWECFWVMN